MELQQSALQKTVISDSTVEQPSQPLYTPQQARTTDNEAGKATPQVEHEQQSKQLMPNEANNDQSCLSYGKNLVVLRTKANSFPRPRLYKILQLDLCFLPTFLVFALVSYLLISYIDAKVENLWAKAITKIICCGECLSYLLVAFSDPGIAKPVKQENKNGVIRTTFCRKCRFNVPRKTFHCSYCDVCIEGYDHHCPWTSKCIGRNNLYRFYLFLFMTPIFIVYCAFAVGFAGQVGETGPHLSQMGKKG